VAVEGLQPEIHMAKNQRQVGDLVAEVAWAPHNELVLLETHLQSLRHKVVMVELQMVVLPLEVAVLVQ
jgi:hypothetical protein